MDFIANQEAQNRLMLDAIGVKSPDALFKSIPESLKLQPPLADDGLSEYEGLSLMEAIAAQNSYQNMKSYLGAGAYEHHIPALVPAICSKSEFLTSYTPYQAEASQGILQAVFEYQSAICAITGLGSANASVYDGASAVAEACLMALRIQKDRNAILIAETLHPHYLAVAKQYLSSHHTVIIPIPFLEDGRLNQEILFRHLDSSVAAVVIQSPNVLGLIEDVKPIASKAKENGVLTVLAANPMAYGIYATPKELGVDIAVGDCQPFGIPLQFGGPYAGYMACKEEYVRQLPGRIVGETTDAKGNRGFVLTLQAREQHIRREKATSNICTSQASCALAALIAILWYGKEGIQKIALDNFKRASYLKSELEKIPGMQSPKNTPIFNEFAIGLPCPIEKVQHHFRRLLIEPGLALRDYFPTFKNHLLIAVTETKSKDDLDAYVRIMKEALA